MKNTFNLTTRFAATAFATGALCCATPLFAQEDQSTPESSPSASASSSESTSTGSSDTQSSSTEKSSTTSKSSTGSATSGAKAEKSAGTTSGAANKQDQQFMQTAAKDGMKEVEMGKMAEQHGQSAEVKRLGKTMVTDHTNANTKLMAVAKKNG